MGRATTPHEAFASTFDVAPSTQSTRPPATQTHTFASGVNGFEYGFGSATRRFQNEVYPQHLPYGLANKTVIALGRTPFVPVTQLTDAAPSAMLPEFAARYQPEPGRAFSYGPSREHPPGQDGQALYWVQAKDNQPPTDHGDPPDLLAVPAPRGTGGIESLHEQPLELLAPVHRREALVFDKCQQRARLALRKAANDACRLAHIAHAVHPNGLLGLEGPLAPQTILYADVRGATLAQQSTREAHAQGRHDNLRDKRDTPLSYPLLSHSSRPAPHDLIFARKGQVSGMSAAPPSGAAPLPAPSAQHFELRPATLASAASAPQGGFRSNQERPLRPHDAARAQRLHDVQSGGRAYDIISNITTHVQPSRGSSLAAPDRSTSDRRMHPSNVSMPRRSGSARQWPIPDSHVLSWKPASPTSSPTRKYLS